MNENVFTVEARALAVRFFDRPIFQDLHLTVAAGSTVALTGRSGEGKTTLLHVLAGLLEPTEGSVKIHGKDPYAMSETDASTFRLRNLGFVFQSADLVPELTLQENVALPSLLAGGKRKPAMAAALELLSEMGIDDDTARRKPVQVSGGQQQRCAIARAVSTSPQVIFADEPTGALDAETTQAVLDLLLDKVRTLGTTLIVVTHDADVAGAMDRQLELREGTLYEC